MVKCPKKNSGAAFVKHDRGTARAALRIWEIWSWKEGRGAQTRKGDVPGKALKTSKITSSSVQHLTGIQCRNASLGVVLPLSLSLWQQRSAVVFYFWLCKNHSRVMRGVLLLSCEVKRKQSSFSAGKQRNNSLNQPNAIRLGSLSFTI